MSRNSSRIAGASMKNSTTGCGPSRSGWTMKVVVAPCLVGMSIVCSIMAHQLSGSDQFRGFDLLLLEERLGVVDRAGQGLRVARGQAVDRLGDVLDRLHPVLG